MKHILILTLVLVVVLNAQGQELRVVKDNINCTYGIKDRTGNWVVEPTYILIEEYNSGYFSVRNEVGLGMLTPEGKPLLPCVHDNIRISTNEWQILSPYDSRSTFSKKSSFFYFYGFRNNEQIVYNRSGAVIAQFDAAFNTQIQLDTDYSIIAYDRVGRLSQYIDSTGTVVIDKISGMIAPFKGKNYSVVGDIIHSERIASGNARVIDKKGNSLFMGTFDQVTLDQSNMVCFADNQLYGVITMSGDTIIRPLYKRGDSYLLLSNAQKWVILDKRGLSGLMSNDGSILVKPQYDKMYQLKTVNGQEGPWMVIKDSRFGVLDAEGAELIPMNFDQLYSIHFITDDARNMTTRYIGVDKGKHYYIHHQGAELASEAYDSLFPIGDYNYGLSLSLTRGFIAKRNGKYGVLNPDGSEFTPCILDLRHEISSDRYLMGRDEGLTEYHFNRDGIQTNDWERIFSDGSLNIYAFRHQFIALSNSKEGNTGKILSNFESFQRRENLLMVQESVTRNWLFFNLKTQKKLPIKNIINVNNSKSGQFAVFTRSGNHGIIDGEGRVVLDTIYKNISFDRRSTHIWATKIVGNRYVCVLLDSIGRQVTPNQFDTSFDLNNGDQIVSQNQKKGLMDTKTLTWKIRPEHFCLIKLFEEYYYVANKLNKKGIIRDDGSTVIPVEYDTIILIYSNCQLNGLCPKGETRRAYWVARQGSTEYLIDQDGRRMNSKSTMLTLKSKLFFADDTTINGAYHYTSFPTLDYSPSLHFLRDLTLEQIQEKRKALWKSSILKRAVLDTMDRIWLARIPNCGQNYNWGTITLTNDSKASPLEDKARKSCECFQTNRYNYGNAISYQLRSIGAKFVTIDISYQNQNYGWDHFQSQAPPPILGNQHINIIEDNGKARYLDLKDIFPDNDVLMQEFIEALKKRDDLKLECSSIENMLSMIEGSFSCSEEGIILYLNQQNHYNNSASIELLIPIENLTKYEESQWMVPILKS